MCRSPGIDLGLHREHAMERAEGLRRSRWYGVSFRRSGAASRREIEECRRNLARRQHERRQDRDIFRGARIAGGSRGEPGIRRAFVTSARSIVVVRRRRLGGVAVLVAAAVTRWRTIRGLGPFADRPTDRNLSRATIRAGRVDIDHAHAHGRGAGRDTGCTRRVGRRSTDQRQHRIEALMQPTAAPHRGRGRDSDHDHHQDRGERRHSTCPTSHPTPHPMTDPHRLPATGPEVRCGGGPWHGRSRHRGTNRRGRQFLPKPPPPQAESRERGVCWHAGRTLRPCLRATIP